MARNSWQQTTSVFLIGLGVGAGLALLFAPKSGEETRDEIEGAVNDGVDSVIAQGKKMGRRAQNTFEQAKARVKEVAEAGEQAYRETRATSS
jgi:gas vesicle protein